MSCCGKKKKSTVNTNTNKSGNIKISKYSSAVKSNRVPAGSIARECSICKTKTIARFCPICNISLVEEKK